MTDFEVYTQKAPGKRVMSSHHETEQAALDAIRRWVKRNHPSYDSNDIAIRARAVGRVYFGGSLVQFIDKRGFHMGVTRMIETA
jgi:hypothetical protein